jgi:hypothetical protein
MAKRKLEWIECRQEPRVINGQVVMVKICPPGAWTNDSSIQRQIGKNVVPFMTARFLAAEREKQRKAKEKK